MRRVQRPLMPMFHEVGINAAGHDKQTAVSTAGCDISIPIDYSSYKPIAEHNEYCGKEVSEDGSISPCEPLPPRFHQYITNTLEMNSGLWNGNQGLRGIPYNSSPRWSGAGQCLLGQATISRDELQNLRRTYVEMKKQGEDIGRRRRAYNNLKERNERSSKLETEISRFQQKVIVLKTLVKELNDAPGSGTGRVDLLRTLEQAETDLESIKDSAKQCRNEIARLKTEIQDIESSNLTRLAILERIFGKDPTGITSVRSRSSRFVGWGADAALLKQRRSFLFAQRTCVAKFYIDAKTGLSCLYELEATVKQMLENIQAVSRSSAAEEISPSNRMRYVKQLREKADKCYRNVIQYAPFTPIAMKQGEILISADKVGGKCGWRGFLHPQKRKVQQTLFQCFDNVPRGRWSNRTLLMLYTHTAGVYREINDAYDYQKSLMNGVLTDLKAHSKQLSKVEHDLVTARERILFDF